MPSTIAACENVYRAFSSIVDAFWKSFPDIHSLTVVSRSPAAINANHVVTIGERSSLVGSGDATT